MIITKEHQEAMIIKYFENHQEAMIIKYFENHTASETESFSEGMEAMFNLIKQ